jgi:hypothetical protein
MAAFAAIGRLPDTIMDRAVNIDLQRRTTGERVAQFRIRRDGPKLADLAARLSEWVAGIDETLADAEPALPVEDRAADAWEPLVAIAEAAGGHWPARARAACTALVALAAADDDELGTLLLADIREVFDDAGESFMPSAMLMRELRGIEESPWSEYELTASKLAQRLKPFGVKPGHNAAKTVRGYSREALRDAFQRYLRPKPSERPTQGADHGECDENGETAKRPKASSPSGFGQPRTRTDDLADTENSGNHTGHSDISDGRTGSDTYTARNGTPAPGFQPPAGVDRCGECGFHIPTQGHRDDCTAKATR